MSDIIHGVPKKFQIRIPGESDKTIQEIMNIINLGLSRNNLLSSITGHIFVDMESDEAALERMKNENTNNNLKIM